jgi:hypothetical protein
MTRSTRTSLLVAALALLVGVGLFLQRGGDDHEVVRSPEAVARGAFQALQRGSKDAYEALLPTETQLRAVVHAELEKLAPAKRTTRQAELEKAGGLPAILEKRKAEALERFTQARSESSRAFDWKDAAFVGLDQSQLEERDGGLFQGLRMRFLVRVGEELHEFKAHKAVLVEQQWCLVDGVSYRGIVGGGAKDEIEYLEETQKTLREELADVEEQNAALRSGASAAHEQALTDLRAQLELQERRRAEMESAYELRISEMEKRYEAALRKLREELLAQARGAAAPERGGSS